MLLWLSIVNLYFFFYYFTLYPAHSRLDRGNIVLKYSITHFPPNSVGIARHHSEEMKILNISFPRLRYRTYNLSYSHVCAPASQLASNKSRKQCNIHHFLLALRLLQCSTNKTLIYFFFLCFFHDVFVFYKSAPFIWYPYKWVGIIWQMIIRNYFKLFLIRNADSQYMYLYTLSVCI